MPCHTRRYGYEVSLRSLEALETIRGAAAGPPPGDARKGLHIAWASVPARSLTASEDSTTNSLSQRLFLQASCMTSARQPPSVPAVELHSGAS
jgi:hypothetical protein